MRSFGTFLLLLCMNLPWTANSAPVKKKRSYAETKTKCEALPEAKQKKIAICRRIQAYEIKKNNPDPLLGVEPLNPRKGAYAIYGSAGVLGNNLGFDVEVEKQWEHWGVGLFYKTIQVTSDMQNGGELEGSAMGLSARLRFYPQWVTFGKKNPNLGVFTYVGQATLKSTFQGELPEYVFWGGGLDAAYPILRTGSMNLNIYGKISVDYIYHEESMFLHLGGMTSLGIKIDF